MVSSSETSPQFKSQALPSFPPGVAARRLQMDTSFRSLHEREIPLEEMSPGARPGMQRDWMRLHRAHRKSNRNPREGEEELDWSEKSDDDDEES